MFARALLPTFPLDQLRTLTCGVALMLSIGLPVTRLSAQAPSPTRFTTVVEGTGPDVILIPGLATPRDVWGAEASLLAPHYRLHLVQLNGFGSQPAGVNASGEILGAGVAELHAYIESNKLHTPTLIGHSLGGLLAMMLAERYPKDVGKLMVVDTLPFVGLMFSPQATPAMTQPQAAAMRDQLEQQTQEQFAQGEGLVMARLVKSTGARAVATAWAAASDHRVVAQAMYEDLVTDVRSGLPNLQMPLTVLYAQDAGIGDPANTTALYTSAYAGTPHLRIVPIENSYHFIMLDQPKAFDAAVEEFLRK